jgi:hypothetical protein
MKQKLAEFQKDPVAWLKVNLAPREYETRTTIDGRDGFLGRIKF